MNAYQDLATLHGCGAPHQNLWAAHRLPLPPAGRGEVGGGDIVVLIGTFEDIVNKSANGLGGNKSGNSVQGENPLSLYIVS